ncbi:MULTISPECIES: hypothetical protein [unclassified Microcoleus]|uniref:hypothetical protein n=1 Tax=unclassified Microcoleus TaxID=2642155 RepID=UPI002FD21483
MNLSFKNLRFIIKAIEHKINAYQERWQVIEEVDEDEAADIGNDIKFLELLIADMRTSLEQHTGRENIAYEQALSEALEETFAEWETTEAMTAAEACKRLRVISYQALE